MDLPAGGARSRGRPLPGHRQRTKPGGDRHVARRTRRRRRRRSGRRRRRRAVPVEKSPMGTHRGPAAAVAGVIELARRARWIARRRLDLGLTPSVSPHVSEIRARPACPVRPVPVRAVMGSDRAYTPISRSLSHIGRFVGWVRRPRRIRLPDRPQPRHQNPQHQPPAQTRRPAPAHTARRVKPHARGPPTALGIFKPEPTLRTPCQSIHEMRQPDPGGCNGRNIELLLMFSCERGLRGW